MSTEIQQSELRNDNAAIMRRVAAGEAFTVTVNGRPVADVMPHQRDTGRRRFVPATEVAAMAETSPLSKQQADAWLRDIREGRDEEPEDPWTRQVQKRHPQASR
jgi:prevent-host-death family protein